MRKQPGLHVMGMWLGTSLRFIRSKKTRWSSFPCPSLHFLGKLHSAPLRFLENFLFSLHNFQ